MAIHMCSKLFHHTLASTLNWAGTEKKEGIKSKKIGSLILGKGKCPLIEPQSYLTVFLVLLFCLVMAV